MKKTAALILAVFAAAAPLSAQTVEQWQQSAVQKYPSLRTAGSPLNQRFLAIVAAKRAADPSFFEKPDWPWRAANAAVEELQKEELAAREKAKAEELAAQEKEKAMKQLSGADRFRAEEGAKAEQQWERDKARWVFDRLIFGDSEEVIVSKLKTSKLVTPRTAGTARVELGSRYRWIIGETKFNMDFEMKDGLAAIIFECTPQSSSALDSLVHEDWEKVRGSAIALFGQPTKSEEYPIKLKLRRGGLTVTDVWERPDRRVKLGVTEGEGRCNPTLRISDPARVAKEDGEK